MKIAAAQVRSLPGEIVRNVHRHCEVVQSAAVHGVNLIMFPELSLTGYEPSLASRLAIDESDACLQPLQEMRPARHRGRRRVPIAFGAWR